MKLTVTEIAIHKETESPVFGELTTRVRIDDEGGGMFFIISQSTDSGLNEIRMDFKELDYLVAAIRKLERGDIESKVYDDRPR
jgi:hypothetical protein